MRDAYETDNGPGGMSWEIYRDGEWEASLPSDTDFASLAPVRVWTYASWEQAQLDGQEMASGPDAVLEEV